MRKRDEITIPSTKNNIESNKSHIKRTERNLLNENTIFLLKNKELKVKVSRWKSIL